MDKKLEARIEKLIGRRDWPENANPLDYPIELGYRCPICKIPSEDLWFSEYYGCLWCPKCKVDIPSFLCVYGDCMCQKEASPREKVKRATKIYLDIMEETQKLKGNLKPKLSDAK